MTAKSCWVRLNMPRFGVLTFSPHSHLETFLEATVLALIAVVLVDGAVAGAPALVRQIPPHRALEETLAS